MGSIPSSGTKKSTISAAWQIGRERRNLSRRRRIGGCWKGPYAETRRQYVHAPIRSLTERQMRRVKMAQDPFALNADDREIWLRCFTAAMAACAERTGNAEQVVRNAAAVADEAVKLLRNRRSPPPVADKNPWLA